jgi:hypothetical protein
LSIWLSLVGVEVALMAVAAQVGLERVLAYLFLLELPIQ